MKIIIPGPPVSKMRHRSCNRGKFIMHYDPQDKEKKRVSKEIKAQLDHMMSDGYDGENDISHVIHSQAYEINIKIYLPINQSDSIATKNAKLWGLIPANKKPDYDNVSKFYLDCCNGILWDDDALVVKGLAEKLFSEEPRVEIEVMPSNKKIKADIKKVLTLFSPAEMKQFMWDVDNFLDMHIIVSIMQENDINQGVIDACNIMINFSKKYAANLSKIAKFSTIDNFEKIECKNV